MASIDLGTYLKISFEEADLKLSWISFDLKDGEKFD